MFTSTFSSDVKCGSDDHTTDFTKRIGSLSQLAFFVLSPVGLVIRVVVYPRR